MLTDQELPIVNAEAHLAGAIVFGIFLALILRGGPGRRWNENWLALACAALAFCWNTGAFLASILPAGNVLWVVEALDFSCLSLLPAVLLHKSLAGRFRVFTIIGYTLSAFSTLMHLCEKLTPQFPLHGWALWVITWGFGALTLICVGLLVFRGDADKRLRTSQIVASMALLLFAVTFSHFGAGHAPRPWSKELIVHHAGIPIALLILLQDYRLAFLDAFVRFLANVMLAVILGAAALRLAPYLDPGVGLPQAVRDAAALAGLGFLLILFSYLRGLVQRWLTMVVFRQGDVQSALHELRSRSSQAKGETEYLPWAAERLAVFAGADRFALADRPAPAGEDWVEAAVPIPISPVDVRQLLLGRRRGGRRYLSEDLRALGQLAAAVAEEVERFRQAEMQRLVAEAELRALQAQINPHFLFNALNTIYGIIPREAAAARRTVLNLADIFRYFLQSDKILIPLSEELKIVRSYLEIERLRLGSRLRTEIDVDPAAESFSIPILSVQPLVENAIKHGVSLNAAGGWLKLTATLDDRQLKVVVEDSGAGDAAPESSGAGVGLMNVTRRLQLCYGMESKVEMHLSSSGTAVWFAVDRVGRESTNRGR